MSNQPRTAAGMKDVEALLKDMRMPDVSGRPAAAPAPAPVAPQPAALRPPSNGATATPIRPRTQRAERRPTSPRPSPTLDDVRGRGRARSVRVDRDVARLLGVAATVSNRGYTEIALAAVEEHHQHAATLPSAPAPPAAAAPAGGLFPPRQQRVTVPRDLLSLYLTDPETEVLDQVAASSGLSRSELVSRSLRAHLARQLYAPAAAVLELQSSGDGVNALKTRIEAAAGGGVPAPALPDKPDGWMALPEAWGRALADVLDAAQSALHAESWTGVVAAALRDGAR